MDKPTEEQINNATEQMLDKWVSEYIFDRPYRKPTHGTCCTCQICGQANDVGCGCGYADYRWWEVVERMCAEDRDGQQFCFRMTYKFSDEYGCWATFDWKEWSDTHPLYAAHGDTVGLAVCRATLLAHFDIVSCGARLEKEAEAEQWAKARAAAKAYYDSKSKETKDD